MRLALTSCIALAAAVTKVSAGCWAQSQGYKCCSNPSNTKVEYTDSSGNWGIENNDWCGIDYSYNANSGNNNQCTGNGAYRCCNTCDVVYTDEDGKWGYEYNDWCGIKNSCNGNGGQNSNQNQCTGNGAYRCCNSCNTTYTDNDGRWGFENNDWCGIKYSCPQQASTTRTTVRTTTTTRQQTQTYTNNSGVPENPPDFSGQTGKTTRYWDCCLASCSWKENAKNCNNPVNACQKSDGITKFTDFSNLWRYKSICDGGSIAMCNDQQPWAINDNVSYGFVASHEECCTCQRLKFTSGPVAGKQMIVQTTNTGGDLSQNHFDIQMPGGGFGIFDGCTSQFGLSASVWGERYGGLSSASQCSGLPANLQKGCKWRFEWFMNADNPAVVFERVQCPKELTDITGCVPNDDASQKKPW
jgi:Glycosyl hydrolase family 45./Cellulose or protein binding domain.